MIIALAAAGVLLWFSPQVLRAASDAAAVFASGVLPALFPLMVLNNVSAALTEKRPSSMGKATVSAALFAFVSGSPASAQRLAHLRRGFPLNPASLYGMAGLTGVMSPLFIVGSLARGMGSPHAAWLTLAGHWGGALLTGAAVGLLMKTSRAAKHTGSAAASAATSLPHRPPALAAVLPGAIAAAAQALLAVCGTMMLFSVVAAVIKAALGLLFPRWTADSAPTLAVLWALLEIGGGAFAVLDAFPAYPVPLLAALCSFGGLSLWLQNLLFLDKDIRPGVLLLIRGLHGALAYAVCTVLLRLFPLTAAAASAGSLAVIPSVRPSLPALLVLCSLALPRLVRSRP